MLPVSGNPLSYAISYHAFDLYQERETDQISDYRNNMTKIFDAHIFDEMVKDYPDIKMPTSNPALLITDLLLFNELLMRVNFVKRNKLANHLKLKNLKEKASRLVLHIQKEYHL